MPWTTPNLRSVREMVRGEIIAKLAGANFIGNSVLRVMADAMAALSHLVLRYLDWQSEQYLPDTSETEFLDRHGNIWLVNSDGSKGRKVATFAVGSVTVTGLHGFIVPSGTVLEATLQYETTEQIVLGTTPTPVHVRAIDAGADGNVLTGNTLAFVTPISGVDTSAVVVSLTGGADAEDDNELRDRVLQRIRNPPMGGDAEDYVQWTKAVPGVTRAWSFPLEMGIGTVTVRFMSDELRVDNDGFPILEDITAVSDYLNTVRPVAVKDFFVVAPIPQPIEFTIRDLQVDDEATRASIEQSVRDMFMQRASPGVTIYSSWVSEAISRAIGEDHHTLTMSNTPMDSPGHMAVLGSIIYA